MPNSADREAQTHVLIEVTKSLQDALARLDATDAPADIGAHIDLAICRLQDIINK